MTGLVPHQPPRLDNGRCNKFFVERFITSHFFYIHISSNYISYKNTNVSTEAKEILNLFEVGVILNNIVKLSKKYFAFIDVVYSIPVVVVITFERIHFSQQSGILFFHNENNKQKFSLFFGIMRPLQKKRKYSNNNKVGNYQSMR